MTLVETIVVAFVVVALVAIALRFMPRDRRGARRLPRVIDESLGMYVLRGALGRRREPAGDAEPVLRPIVGGIARHARGASTPALTLPTRVVVSGSHAQAGPLAWPRMVAPIEARPPALRPSQTTPPSALALQRRIAGSVAAIAAAIAVLGVLLVPRPFEGAVLSATGTPPGALSGVSGVGDQEPTAGASPIQSDPAASPSSTTSIVSPTSVAPGKTPRPTPAPARTGQPTPRPAPRPTPHPPTATPALAPTPTPAPTRVIIIPPPPPPPPPTPPPTLPPTPAPTLPPAPPSP